MIYGGSLFKKQEVKMVKTMSYGAVLWDIVEEEKHIGGCTLNLAAHLGKLGMKAYMFSKLGKDSLGEEALDEIRNLGVDSSFIQVDDTKSTGYAKITLDQNKVPTYEFASNASHEYMDVDDTIIEKIKNEHIALFCYGTYCQAGAKTRQNLYKILEECSFPLVFCDINLRAENPSKELIEGSLKYADILKLNDEEVQVLAQVLYGTHLKESELIEKIRSHFRIKIACVTKGEKGCKIYDEEGDAIEVEAVKITAVDTVGAGDAFGAGFVFSYYNGLHLLKCGENGNMLGGYVAGQKGAIPEYSNKILQQFEIKG